MMMSGGGDVRQPYLAHTAGTRARPAPAQGGGDTARMRPQGQPVLYGGGGPTPPVPPVAPVQRMNMMANATAPGGVVTMGSGGRANTTMANHLTNARPYQGGAGATPQPQPQPQPQAQAPASQPTATTTMPAQQPQQPRPTATTTVNQNAGQVPANNAIGLNNLGGLLERMLGTPSAFGMKEVKGMRKYLEGERAAEFEAGMGRINTDAANRGVFYSTIPNKGAAALQGDLARATSLADTQLMEMMARYQDSGQQNAIQNALAFLGQGQQGATSHAAGLGNLGGLMLANGGQMPDMTSLLATIGTQGGGAPQGMDPAVVQLISQMMGLGGSGTAAPPSGSTVSTAASGPATARPIINPDTQGWS